MVGQEYWDHEWQRIYSITIFLLISEYAGLGSFRWTSFLKPVPAILRSRSGRRFFNVVWLMLPKLSQSLSPMVGEHFVPLTVVMTDSVGLCDHVCCCHILSTAWS